MNKEIKQILKNQANIVSALAKLIKEEKPTILMEALDGTYWETIHLLNPIKEPLVKELTKDAFSEEVENGI